ncbi:SAM-dependent methyltransferase [Halarcobacter ebronensis]|uniref:SAM-dependent methyltransferase n=1 Tax=Halarcobacter ebronensis TaxID=1462615 RepID=A0A4Q0Y6R7_9BACT|nr:SAM-dependent methyltransferase [Halarcobacter ebronensis]
MLFYEDIDFNELYKIQKEITSFKAKKSKDWDKKAQSMNEKVHKSIYNDKFLEQVDLDGISTVLDVGCGVGNLSLRFAKKVDKVYALDYSEAMIELLKENMQNQNITNIEPIKCSWFDQWDEVPNADLVVASRSLEVKDMQKALVKLDAKANKKVVVSYKVGGYFIPEEILRVLNREIIQKPDYIYLVNILFQMGINASVSFIKSEGQNKFYSSKEKFIESVSWSLDGISDEERERLEKYFDSTDLTKKEDYNLWAVLSWEKEL